MKGFRTRGGTVEILPHSSVYFLTIQVDWPSGSLPPGRTACQGKPQRAVRSSSPQPWSYLRATERWSPCLWAALVAEGEVENDSLSFSTNRSAVRRPAGSLHTRAGRLAFFHLSKSYIWAITASCLPCEPPPPSAWFSLR